MTETEILLLIHERRMELAPLVVEYMRLVEADRVLTEVFGDPVTSDPDGPRRADVRSSRRRTNRRPPPISQPQQVRLNVQTVTGPTATEIDGRKVAYVTSG